MNTIWVILKNADMMEARGAMVLTGDGFQNKQNAIAYIEKARGAMGICGEKAKKSGKDWYANHHIAKSIEIKDY
jgi:hypothetical protein